MRKIIFFGILIIALFLVVGFGCDRQNDAKNVVERVDADEGEAGSDVAGEENNLGSTEGLKDGRVLVDRVRYVQAGNPPFDFTNVVFHQKSGSGYRAEINSDKNIKAEIMTDKDCILKGQGDKYTAIKEDEGKEIVILGEKNEGESRNLCIGATATGSGQIEINFKVVELV